MIALLLAASTAFASGDLVPTVRGLADTVGTARGLPIPSTLRIEVETPEAVRAMARKELDRPENVEAVTCGEALLEVMREVEPGFDLRATSEAIQEGAVAGYYDSEDDRLVLVARGGAFADASLPEADRMTAMHELVHAAQDAAFDLVDLRHRDMPTSDIDLAIRGMIEGDATWWMLPLAADMPADLLRAMPADVLANGLSQATLGIDPDAPPDLIGSLPPTMRADLLSPYLDGFLFAHALMQHGGVAALDAAYRDPPLSSEHILHPERYLRLDRDVPVLFTFHDAVDPGPGWTHVCDDGLGERVLRGMLDAVDGVDGVKAADGWDGDRLRVWRGAGGEAAGAWILTMDSAQDAAQLETALRAWLNARAQVPGRGRRAMWWTGLGRADVLVRDDADLYVVLGLPRAQATSILVALRDTPRAPLTDLRAVSTPLPPRARDVVTEAAPPSP